MSGGQVGRPLRSEPRPRPLPRPARRRRAGVGQDRGDGRPGNSCHHLSGSIRLSPNFGLSPRGAEPLRPPIELILHDFDQILHRHRRPKARIDLLIIAGRQPTPIRYPRQTRKSHICTGRKRTPSSNRVDSRSALIIRDCSENASDVRCRRPAPAVAAPALNEGEGSTVPAVEREM
jgi:hypothetical protein